MPAYTEDNFDRFNDYTYEFYYYFIIIITIIPTPVIHHVNHDTDIAWNSFHVNYATEI